MTFLETTLYHGDDAEVGGGDIIPYLSNDSWKVLRYIEAF